MDSRTRAPHIEGLLAHAAVGDTSSREKLLAMYRPYLRLVAERRLPQIVQKRVDASDVVQQTLVDAVRGLPEFRGQAEPEFTAWIMRLLDRNLLMSVRNNTLAKRDVRLEQEWGDASGSAVMMWHSLAADGMSPPSSVFRGEAALYLAMALEKLPADQRTAVELRYIGQMSLQAVAGEMGRSVGSVAGLVRRGVAALEELLPSEFGDLA
jgi:RNA polymerase sigma-70 factor (ECF subfamily)